jgi:hypothetical protein
MAAKGFLGFGIELTIPGDVETWQWMTSERSLGHLPQKCRCSPATRICIRCPVRFLHLMMFQISEGWTDSWTGCATSDTSDLTSSSQEVKFRCQGLSYAMIAFLLGWCFSPQSYDQFHLRNWGYRHRLLPLRSMMVFGSPQDEFWKMSRTGAFHLPYYGCQYL